MLIFLIGVAIVSAATTFEKNTIGQNVFLFKSERELKKHNEWQNSQFCQFCWPCRLNQMKLNFEIKLNVFELD